ncbi:MAG: transposase [Burkholderiales bacterium]
MIVDGASSHRARDLAVPENIRLLPLPAYAPELNPQEHVWDELREKEFPNRVFNHLDAGQSHRCIWVCPVWRRIIIGSAA